MARKKKISYIARKGSPIKAEKVQKYGEHISVLIEENNGCINPDIVVQDAEATTSPLHDFFEWDDAVASGKYRTWQARQLLGSIEVRVKVNDHEEEMRAFHNVIVTSDETSERGYAPVAHVMSDIELRAQVLEKALKELNAVRKKYKHLEELAVVFDAVEKVKEKA